MKQKERYRCNIGDACKRLTGQRGKVIEIYWIREMMINGFSSSETTMESDKTTRI